MAKRAKILASKLSLTELFPFFDQRRKEFWSKIHSYTVGNEFLNCSIDERFYVIDVYDLGTGSTQTLCFAEMQYSDGTFWDENARAIIQRLDYQLTEFNITEEGITVNNSCGEENIISLVKRHPPVNLNCFANNVDYLICLSSKELLNGYLPGASAVVP